MLRLRSALVEGKGYSSAQALDLPALLASLANAEVSGAEAVGIGNGFDPGLWEARELLTVPVLGLFETVAFYALRLGWKLGVLCSGHSGPARIEELASRYGIAARLVRPVAVDVAVPDIVAAFQEPGATAEIIEASRACLVELERRGAEVAVIASGALDVLFHTSGGHAEPSIPLMPATRVLACEVETAAVLGRFGVPGVSRVGRFRSPPTSVRSALQQEP
jgi:Asp/Glu/hydantoin racemase